MGYNVEKCEIIYCGAQNRKQHLLNSERLGSVDFKGTWAYFYTEVQCTGAANVQECQWPYCAMI